MGFCQLVDGFNGLRELLSREDGAPLLLQKYLKLSLDNVKNVDEFGSIRLIYFEVYAREPPGHKQAQRRGERGAAGSRE